MACTFWTRRRMDHISLNLEQIGRRFGWVVIMSPIRLYTRGWSCCYVHVACTGCGTEKWCSLSNLEQRKSTGCLACERPRHMGPSWLYHRLQAAKDRCTNPNNPAWLRYGAWNRIQVWLNKRGVRVRRDKAGLAESRYGDRPERQQRALRARQHQMGDWAAEQTQHETVQVPCVEPKRWPYAKNPWRRLAAGMTREQIIADAWKAVAEKRKNWRGIRDKLLSMTS